MAEENMNSKKFSLFNFPEEIVESILSQLSYDDVTKSRLICKKFNRIGNWIVDRGFRSCIEPLDEVEELVQKAILEEDDFDFFRKLFTVEAKLKVLRNELENLKKYFSYNMFFPGKIIDVIEKFRNLTAEILNQRVMFKFKQLPVAESSEDSSFHIDFMCSADELFFGFYRLSYLAVKHLTKNIAFNNPSLEVRGKLFNSPESEIKIWVKKDLKRLFKMSSQKELRQLRKEELKAIELKLEKMKIELINLKKVCEQTHCKETKKESKKRRIILHMNFKVLEQLYTETKSRYELLDLRDFLDSDINKLY